MSYNTSVQLGQTAFLNCKVAPGVESVSKLSYRISSSTPTPPDVALARMSTANYTKFFMQFCRAVLSLPRLPRLWTAKQLTASACFSSSRLQLRRLHKNKFSATFESGIQMEINDGVNYSQAPRDLSAETPLVPPRNSN